MEDISLPEGVPSKWEVGHRLRFIESRLFWNGRINRADIVAQFGVSQAQASADLRLYQGFASVNIFYDKTAKTYRAGEKLAPVFIDPTMDRFLGHYLLKDGFLGSVPEVALIPSPPRPVDPVVVRRVIVSAREEKAINVRYQSMSRPEPRWRWISPHAFGHDGYRWHVRAFCADRGRFVDFVLGRIDRLGDCRPRDATPEEDHAWHDWTEVSFRPHPDLTSAQAATVAEEYRMKDGVGTLSVRRAMLFYVLNQLRLEHDGHRPPTVQIQLVNSEIREFLFAAQ